MFKAGHTALHERITQTPGVDPIFVELVAVRAGEIICSTATFNEDGCDIGIVLLQASCEVKNELDLLSATGAST